MMQCFKVVILWFNCIFLMFFFHLNQTCVSGDVISCGELVKARSKLLNDMHHPNSYPTLQVVFCYECCKSTIKVLYYKACRIEKV